MKSATATRVSVQQELCPELFSRTNIITRVDCVPGLYID